MNRALGASDRRDSGYLFYLRTAGNVHRLGDTLLWIDPRTGEILLERSDLRRSSGEQLLHWLLPLHSGVAFGAIGKVAMCLAGIAPSLLAGTGIFIWIRKRRSSRVEEFRRDMLRRTTC